MITIKKYTHILSNWNYNVVEPYIDFINENFNENEHVFVVMDLSKNVPISILEYNNVKTLSEDKNNKTKELFYYFEEAENILLHGLAFNGYEYFRLLFKPKIIKKMTWIAWGADLYQSERSLDGSFRYNLKGFFRNVFSNSFRKKIERFVGIFPPDIKFFQGKYKSTAFTFYASYAGNLYNPFYQKEVKIKTLEQKINDKDTINIQIGHSSFSSLNHISVLDKLEKYKNENIKIFIPLSYGNKSYGDMVKKRALELFGEKIVIITEMMPKEKYMHHLSNIDIAIFNTSRQIGLGNLSPLMYMQKKIYIPKNTVMYDYYQSQGINIVDYHKIEEYNFSEFIEPIDMRQGKFYIEENELNKEKKIQDWVNVFEGLEKEAY